MKASAEQSTETAFKLPECRRSMLVVTAAQLAKVRPSRAMLDAVVDATRDHLLILLHADDVETLALQPTEEHSWRTVQDAVAYAYVTALAAEQRAHRPWLTVTVTLDGWCGYAPGVEEPSWERAFFSVSDSRAAEIVQSWNDQRQKAGLSLLEKQVLPEVASAPFSTSTAVATADGGQCSSAEATLVAAGQKEEERYKHVALGGTFDHLHAGHKILLTVATWLTDDRIFCGVTDGGMLQGKQHPEYLESTESRIAHVHSFLTTICRRRNYVVDRLYDPFGPTITDASIDALVVSRETKRGGDAVQKERAARGFPSLRVRVIDVVAAGRQSLCESEWTDLKLSSTQIRARLEREGAPRLG
ncbi:hypothetical protein THASP1DRAFT_28155 [Thamnocephalis sphaerospora]|uniref:Cytidyltransferase-like domain-containing protein n=1 Tax=Thamnocephalis sphaerospora TaxID=78915 RepID=A0A4P9XV01_9FUNG|nr:hypothetical protein THASP1DRAFT_28155 [Thamnocephalis sphaerospora]|eukprot:RKP10073.1 hypothetical protein THASP1DRAFT_28155 [Thamnocephalis sphaerospora]